MKHKLNLISVVFFLFVYFILGIHAINNIDPNVKIQENYIKSLNDFEKRVDDLKKTVQQNLSLDSVQNQFLSMRIAFKKTEMVIEYYVPYQIYLLNAPAIQSADDKKPPQGMQVLEELFFPGEQLPDKMKALKQIENIKKSIKYLQLNANQIKADSLIFDAMIDEVYRIISLGITGFDSPIAKNSIPEAGSSLYSIKEHIQIMFPLIKKKSIKDADKILNLIDRSILYCNQNQIFDEFDRMYFIKTFLNPLAIWLGEAKIKLDIKDRPRENLLYAGPLVNKYYSLFDSRVFSAGFFGTDSLYQLKEKISLGKKLFFDPIISGNNQRSCATCHNPEIAFTDGLAKSLALDGHSSLKRNAPTLWNSSLQRDLFYDNRRQFMEDLVSDVLGNSAEMSSSAQMVSEKIHNIKNYQIAFKKAYKDDEINAKRIENAISAYVRSLVTFNTRFDIHMNSKKNILNESEVKGFNIFMGKAKCATCHFAPLFSGSKPPHYYIIESEVIGVPLNKDTIHAEIDPDKGRIHMSGAALHEFAFKTPSLRNVSLTAPYMHNGVFDNLDEVVEFYNKGGGAGLGIKIPNQTLPAEKLNLTKEEKSDLVSFLKSLTDTDFPKH